MCTWLHAQETGQMCAQKTHPQEIVRRSCNDPSQCDAAADALERERVLGDLTMEGMYRVISQKKGADSGRGAIAKQSKAGPKLKPRKAK